MTIINQWNIRVYGFLLHQGNFMILREPFGGQMVNKLPGGGMEFGEGSIQTLNRELMEELNLTLDTHRLIHVSEPCITHVLKPNQQLVLLYYAITVKSLDSLRILDTNIKEIKWMPLDHHSIEFLDLDFDREAFKTLLKHEEIHPF